MQAHRFAGVCRAAAPHPFLRPLHALISVLASAESSSPEYVWGLYNEVLHDRPHALSDGSIRVPCALDAQHHRQVLHALVPHADEYTAYIKSRAQLRNARAKLRGGAAHVAGTPVDFSTPQELAPPPLCAPLTDADAAAYLCRVRLLLSNMQASADGSVVMSDYNHALYILAHGGHFGEMRVLWDDARASNLAPDRHTYHCMMQGLFRSFEHERERLKASHGHALLPSKHARLIARKTAQEGNAEKAVHHAAEHTARNASMLIQDMQERGVRPTVLTLDLAARILRISGQLPALLALLRTGFGVDIANPGADSGAPAPSCAPSTDTLNTALMALGEHASVSDMAVAYETMTAPMDVHTADKSPAPANAARRAVQPNTKTFSLLLKHACSVPDTLFLSAALVPQRRSFLSRFSLAQDTVGFCTQQERITEIAQRQRGFYQGLARYFLDECLARYTAQVTKMCTALGVAPPEALHMDDTRSTAAVEAAYKQWKAQGATGRLRVPEALASDAQGVPVFVPPSVRVPSEAVYPLVSLASRRRSITLLRWAKSRLDRVYLVKAAEVEILSMRAEHLADCAEAQSLRASLLAHLARAHHDLDALMWLRFTRIPARLSVLASLSKDRNERKAATKLARAQQKVERRRFKKQVAIEADAVLAV
ncbi:hypothetical protein MVES1_000467 [Malassezia vespertilionis]|uniref:uncharacterized protein n=1 Tax=Malassezia vespertilionis TaxID=2020962 RepID=UPI0024B2481E|nr:uncharacterized protein MVES1_000467 [Malassezia vespertilionis]WFD05141.1 hypothetical protein MVES1_000467 [Malassezia vespertilionis]